MSKDMLQSELSPQSAENSVKDLKFLEDVELGVSLELGVAELTIGQLIRLKPGSVLPLDKRADEPFDFRVNGKLVAKGDPIVVNDCYGVRITSVVTDNFLDE